MNIREQEIKNQLKHLEAIYEVLESDRYASDNTLKHLEVAIGMINSAVFDEDFEKYNSNDKIADDEIADQPASDYDKIQEFCGKLDTWVGRDTVEELRDIFIQAEQDKDYMTTVTDALCDYCRID